MLGVSQGHANVRDNQFDKALENNHTIATVLRTAGYSTAAIGKWGLQGAKRWAPDGDSWPAHPLNRGFDYFFGYMRHSDGHEHYPKEGPYRKPKEVWENRTNIADKLDKCYTADLWVAAAKRWITAHAGGSEAGKPFFLYLAFDTPHATLELPTQPYPTGGGLKGGMQWTGQPGHMISTASGEIDSWTYPDYANATYDDDSNPQTPEVKWPKVYQRYASAVRRIDDGVGDVMQLLRDLKLDENTLVVFTSDNGPSIESYLPKDYAPNHPDFFNSFGPFDGIKRDCWEAGVRMPTIACWPARIPAERTITTPSIFYDWLPTFAEMAGVPAPARTDGVSLLPALTGKGQQRNSLIYSEYYEQGSTPDFKEFDPRHRGRRRNQMQVVRFGDMVGVRYDIKSAGDEFEIYDVAKDPGEKNNLAGAHDRAIDSLQLLMKQWVLQVRRPDTAAARPYDNELVPPSVVNVPQHGVEWKAYAGNFPWVPDVAGLQPAAHGAMKRPDANVNSKVPYGAIYFSGYIRVPADGEYTFGFAANGGALLRIHEAVVVDADYGYANGEERAGKILLKAGLHAFKLYYRNSSAGRPDVSLSWEGPGIKKQTIPAAAFWY
jgi:arylsulfatase A-like enzyme